MITTILCLAVDRTKTENNETIGPPHFEYWNTHSFSQLCWEAQPSHVCLFRQLKTCAFKDHKENLLNDLFLYPVCSRYCSKQSNKARLIFRRFALCQEALWQLDGNFNTFPGRILFLITFKFSWSFLIIKIVNSVRSMIGIFVHRLCDVIITIEAVTLVTSLNSEPNKSAN